MTALRAVFRFYVMFTLFLALFFHWIYGNSRIDPVYVVSITRHAASMEESALITRAEAECPPYEEVAVYFGAGAPAESEGCLWWYESSGMRIPYAITAEAIDYYVQEVHSLEQQAAQVRVNFAYAAQVLHGQPVPGMGGVQADVVQMTLSYSIICGGLCGVFIDKSRSVYIGEDNAVLLVEGDGETSYAVSK